MKWYLMQLFPFKYETVYHEGGQKKLTIWRMFMGRCFNIKNYNIVD